MFEFMVLRKGGQKYFFDLPDGNTIELSTYYIDDSQIIKVKLELSTHDSHTYEIIGTWGPMTGQKFPGEINQSAEVSLFPGDYKLHVDN